MTATIQLPADVEPAVLAAAAGSAVAPTLTDGILTVPDVEQPALDAALASYDPVAVAREHLRAQLADRRYQAEIAGTTWTNAAGEALPVATDRDSQAKLQGLMVAIIAAIRTDGELYKFADGAFRALSNADMRSVILAALAHVKGAFDVEAQKLTLIDQGQDPAMDSGWPA
jgi:hypothetical protein